MAAARIERIADGWVINNERIRLELLRTSPGGVAVASLRNPRTGHEWATAQGPTGAFVEAEAGTGAIAGASEESGFRFSGERTSGLPGGGIELGLAFTNPHIEATLWLLLRCYPTAAVIEYATRLESTGTKTLPPLRRIDPLCLYLDKPSADLRPYSADPRGEHGFHSTGRLDKKSVFDNWIVLEDPAKQESLLVGGDLGAGILRWEATVEQQTGGTLVRAGAGFAPSPSSADESAYQVSPGRQAETPMAFLGLAQGDPDDVSNEAVRYLKQHVMPAPVANTPQAAYCIWLTDPDAEEIMVEELAFARRMGFDVYYHDASWFADSSLVPGTNDWAKGLGSYEESREKFPHGLGTLADAVRKAGMKFGIWVDPGMVDSRRVLSGEIPQSWLALIDGRKLESHHPSLSHMTQLCLGNPEVVAWVKHNLGTIIDAWELDWIKWDPSGTVNYACDRTDHGHNRRDGAYAAYQGLMEVWAYLHTRFPALVGYECMPSLRYARLNPGPPTLLPGGYVNEFITGPMVSPNVWGSPAGSQSGEVPAGDKELSRPWYSASALDYNLRKHFMHGVSFGNINGAVAQRLSHAPPGYIEAFKRNLLHFKQYRHLLIDDVYHPRLADAEQWSALQYVDHDALESVLFVFRHLGGAATNTVKLRGLAPQASYLLTSLNDRPGRERTMLGEELLSRGLEVMLPDAWLATGDGLPDERYSDQLRYGSDVILLRRVQENDRIEQDV